MHKIISEFYRIFIRPVDPGLFITKYALKSVAACSVALGLAYLGGMSGKFMQWCAYGAVVVAVFRAGGTLAKRKLVALGLICAVVCLVPVSTIMGNYTPALEIYLFILAFAVFFIPVLGVGPATAGIGTLIVNLLALTSPDSFVTGLHRSSGVLFGAAVCYVFIFYIFPMKPEKILTRAGAVALTDIGDYFRAVASSTGSDNDLQELSKIHERTVESVRRYRRFMEAMNVDPVKDLGSYEGPSALYALLVRMIEAVVGLSNSRQFAEHSAVFSEMRFKFSDITGKSSIAFDVLAAKLSTGRGEVDLQAIDNGIAELENELLQLGAYKRDEGLRDEFLEAWGAIYGLRNLSLEFSEMSKLCCSGGLAVFADSFESLKKEFRWDSIPFRHAVKAAMAITFAIVAARFLELRHAVWLPVSVIVIMRPSVGGTLRIGWKRLWGTVLGAALGVGILFLEPPMTVLGSLIALSFFMVILLRVFSYTAFSCCLTTGVILLLGIIFTDGWQFGVERILDTFLGVAIGIAASFGVWPNLARKSLRKKMAALSQLQGAHFKMLSESYLYGKVSEPRLVQSRIEASVMLDECGIFFQEAAAEPGLLSWQRDDLTRLLRTFTRMHSLLMTMSTIIRRGYGGPLPSIADGMKNILTATVDYYAWLECYTLTPDECPDQPDFDKAIEDFMKAVSDARIRGDFEDVPIERRNNISAFIWNIRALGSEIARAARRLHELRYGRS